MKKIIFAIACLFLAFQCNAEIILVKPDGSGDQPTIQAAIDAATDGDEVVLAIGTYTGYGNRDIDPNGKAITIRSIDPNDPNIVATTIIDCNGTEEDPHRGFYFHTGEDENSVVAGFTITKGFAYKGGGIYCRFSSSPTISNCIIRGNVAPWASGFPWNFAQDGGGIYCSESSPVISNCQLLDNTATANGGAIYSYRGNTLVSNCVVSGNRAGISGGGIGLNQDNMFIQNCIITGNSSAYVFYGGGGFYCSRSTPTISNCTISGNWTDGYGGGMYVRGSNTTLTNSILWGNNASEGAEIGLREGPFGPALLDVSYSDIEGGQEATYVYGDSTLIWGLCNINADPCFVNPGYWSDPCNTPSEPNDDLWNDGDYHLFEDSPCIDAGDPNYIPEPNETDFDGNPRIVNDIIDMGAYEAPLAPLDLLIELSEYIDAMNLHKGTANSLKAKLNTALRLLEDDNENNDVAAVNLLEAFINAVWAQYDKKIPAAEADILIEIAEEIIQLLSDE